MGSPSRLLGWRLGDGRYRELEPNERGWLWSNELNLWLGVWEGEYLRTTATWLRFHTTEGELVLTGEEAARAEAEAERRRAEQAEERAQRLAEQLRALGVESEDE